MGDACEVVGDGALHTSAKERVMDQFKHTWATSTGNHPALLIWDFCNTPCYDFPNYHHYYLNHASNPLVNQIISKIRKLKLISS
jgi:hypothetical protein